MLSQAFMSVIVNNELSCVFCAVSTQYDTLFFKKKRRRETHLGLCLLLPVWLGCRWNRHKWPVMNTPSNWSRQPSDHGSRDNELPWAYVWKEKCFTWTGHCILTTGVDVTFQNWQKTMSDLHDCTSRQDTARQWNITHIGRLPPPRERIETSCTQREAGACPSAQGKRLGKTTQWWRTARGNETGWCSRLGETWLIVGHSIFQGHITAI